MGGRKKKRAEWRNEFDATNGGRIHSLALFVKTIPPPVDNQVVNQRWKLIAKGKFNEALDELVAADVVDDLTDAERAYCEGWAAYARQLFHHSNQKDEDRFLLDAIDAAIAVHSSGGGMSSEMLAG